MKRIKTLIIDDERNAREEIKRMLVNYPDFELIGEAKNADEAKVLIELRQPDLLFLDIQMPVTSGFELLESLEKVPQVIFTTAFDQYAVKAFEFNALDYLMKPIREERFMKAIEQLKVQLPDTITDPRIFVKDGLHYHFITWKKIHLIESMDNYARLFIDHKKIFIKTSLNQLEKKLDENTFFRINRTQIINLEYVDQIKTVNGSRLKISLLTGDLLDVSDRQSARFRKLIQQ
ncbi:LytTR family DNA-binding domain-containing protein [Pedobacter sp. L105]|uniref:LytR/AlgR family response regulator transcription factor n=1 Tax=Pedobacter sp. L105 TaxID=1641871 RepID=UPI001C20BE72|nr:response regulator transcription factor [Pedobacter sp. L105]